MRIATLRKTFDTCPEPVLITNAKVQIAYVNPAWEKLTKYTSLDVLGKNPRVLQSGKTPPRVYRKIWKALHEGKGIQTEEVIDRSKTGHEYTIHSVIYPLPYKGKPQFYIQIQHDISRRKMEEKHKKSLLSIAAHELKTPITTARFLVEVLQIKNRKKFKDRRTKEVKDLTIIHQQIDRLARLVDDILNIGRLETNKIKLRIDTVELRELIESVITQIKIIRHRHITLRGPQKISVYADRDRIRQVVVNIINNAIKYSEKSTPIKIRIQKKDILAIVSIQDYGPGIPKNQQKKIFEQFYQISERTGDGFGLGLYLSKQIIKRHNGKIWIESELGKGSIFHFSLPLYKNKDT